MSPQLISTINNVSPIFMWLLSVFVLWKYCVKLVAQVVYVSEVLTLTDGK